MDVDAWRDTWTFREGSYSQRVHGAAIKRFFTWAVTFDLLERNPFDKLDPLELKPVPTLPLSPEEVDRLVGAASQCTNGETLATLILLMRWSGLAIRDASCLRRDALLADNSIKTRRQKTNEYVYVKIPADVAERLRAVGSINPAYFFWNGRTTAKDNATVWGNRIRAAFDRAGITPRGSHRLRDTCGCEFLNAGGLMQDLSKLLGHSSIKTTEQPGASERRDGRKFGGAGGCPDGAGGGSHDYRDPIRTACEPWGALLTRERLFVSLET